VKSQKLLVTVTDLGKAPERFESDWGHGVWAGEGPHALARRAG
jgi:hypothetical protein